MNARKALVPFLVALAAGAPADDGGNWTLAASNGFRHVIVGNANARRSGGGVVCKWTVLRNGEPFAADSFDLRDLPPGTSHAYAVPEALEEVRKGGDTASLRVRFVETSGRELARRQLDVPDGEPSAYRPIPGKALELDEDGQTIRFASGDLSVVFSKRTGFLTGLRREGFFSDDVLVGEPIRLVVAEAPELRFDCAVEKAPVVDLRPDEARFTALVRASAPGQEALIELDWTVFRDGAVRCLCRLRPAIGKSLASGAGLLVASGAKRAEIDYFARDGLLGRQSAEAESLATRKTPVRGTRALEVKNGSALLGLAAVGRPFAFSVKTGETVAVAIRPDGDVDCRRPRRLDFMIAPRRFANLMR